jgi:protein required for attachment to host cells
MKPIITWILIADGARARVLRNDGPDHGVTAVDGFVFQGDHSATHDIMSDRQGRSFSSVGAGRSAIEPHSDPHRQLKTKFADRLADILAEGLAQHSYDRLIIVASPVTLGDLRSAISGDVQAKVVGEVAQDLTKLPNGEVAEHINLDQWLRDLDFQHRTRVADAARPGLRDAIGAGFALRGTSKAPASDVQR